jgi:hypothetical protein
MHAARAAARSCAAGAPSRGGVLHACGVRGIAPPPPQPPQPNAPCGATSGSSAGSWSAPASAATSTKSKGPRPSSTWGSSALPASTCNRAGGAGGAGGPAVRPPPLHRSSLPPHAGGCGRMQAHAAARLPARTSAGAQLPGARAASASSSSRAAAALAGASSTAVTAPVGPASSAHTAGAAATRRRPCAGRRTAARERRPAAWGSPRACAHARIDRRFARNPAPRADLRPSPVAPLPTISARSPRWGSTAPGCSSRRTPAGGTAAF